VFLRKFAVASCGSKLPYPEMCVSQGKNDRELGMDRSITRDPARDIEAITVNRWPHGYSYEYLSLFDPEWPKGQAPHEIGRQPFGNIHIANSDAAVFAYTNEAIDQWWRAVKEIVAKKS
jgi:hypothetical protein